jgi:hypothetical protein
MALKAYPKIFKVILKKLQIIQICTLGFEGLIINILIT